MPTTVNEEVSVGRVPLRLPFLLDGRLTDEGEAVEIRAPYDQHVVGTALRGTLAHAESAIAAAVRAFAVTRKLPAYERQAVLRRIGEGLERRREEFARVLAA